MTIPNIGYARSSLEVRYWLHLHPCPTCGERDIGEPKSSWTTIEGDDGEHDGGFYHVTCPRCGHQRSIAFYALDDYFQKFDVGEQLGGANQSQIIGPQDFSIELARCLDALVDDFATLSNPALGVQNDLVWNAKIAASELLKFIPEQADEVPDASFKDAEALAYKRQHSDILTRRYLVDVKMRLDALVQKIRARAEQLAAGPATVGKRRLPLPPFSLASIKLHEQWVQQGDVGENQQLIAKGADAREMQLSSRNLAEVVLEKVTLDRADLSSSMLEGSTFTDVYVRDANLSHAQLRRVTALRSQFSGSDMTACKLGGSSLTDCDFTNTRLPGSYFLQANVKDCVFRGADLTDTLLANATFIDCDLRDADLSVVLRAINTAEGALFLRCDLRGTSWSRRDLSGMRFVDCKMSNLRGRPTVANAIIERPDLSPEADGSHIGTADDVMRTWTLDSAS